jgi:hypothetical protein
MSFAQEIAHSIIDMFIAAFGDTSLHFIEITGCDDDVLTFLQLLAGLLDLRATVRACCIGEHGAGIVIKSLILPVPFSVYAPGEQKS